MSYSFYGGKEGRSIVIKAHFDNIADMCRAFSLGGGYSDVGYHEYVIIDTIIGSFNEQNEWVGGNRKNDPQNGIIYRRGLNYQAKGSVFREDGSFNVDVPQFIKYENENDFRAAFAIYAQDPGAGAEYIGQIVGPQGAATELEVIPWHNGEDNKDFKKYFESKNSSFGEKGQIILSSDQMTPGCEKPPAEIGTVYEEKVVVSDDAENFNPESQIRQSDTAVYNDSIQYGYVNLLDENGNITGCYIAFDIPYTVFDFSATNISPYGLPQNLIVEDENSKSHPFYQKYDIKVPHGIHGKDSILEFNSENSTFIIKEKSYENNATGETGEDAIATIPAKFIDSIVANGNYVIINYTTKDNNNRQESVTLSIPTFGIIGYINDITSLTASEIAILEQNNGNQIYGFYIDSQNKYYIYDAEDQAFIEIEAAETKISYIQNNAPTGSELTGAVNSSIWFELD